MYHHLLEVCGLCSRKTTRGLLRLRSSTTLGQSLCWECCWQRTAGKNRHRNRGSTRSKLQHVQFSFQTPLTASRIDNHPHFTGLFTRVPIFLSLVERPHCLWWRLLPPSDVHCAASEWQTWNYDFFPQLNHFPFWLTSISQVTTSQLWFPSLTVNSLCLQSRELQHSFHDLRTDT